MRYINVRKPGASMVNQPMRPGRLRRLATDVLPMPHHLVSHCIEPTYEHCQNVCGAGARVILLTIGKEICQTLRMRS